MRLAWIGLSVLCTWLVVVPAAAVCTAAIDPVVLPRAHVGWPVQYSAHATVSADCGLTSWRKLVGPPEFDLDGAAGLFYWSPAAMGTVTITIGIINAYDITQVYASTTFTTTVDDNTITQPAFRDYRREATSVPVLGRAYGSTFAGYSLSYQATNETSFSIDPVGPVVPIASSTTPVSTTGLLGTWDISGLPDGGRYLLTLDVLMTDGTHSIVADPVIIDRSARPGWPKRVGPATHAPTLADLDGSGTKSVIVVTHFGELYVWSLDGMQRLLVPAKGATYCGSSVGMLGGQPTIVWCSLGTLYAHRLDGSLAFSIPAPVGYEYRATPTLADLDGTGQQLDIIAPMQSNTASSAAVFVYRYNGSSVTRRTGWPQSVLHSTFYASASVGSLDGSGTPHVIVESYDRVYAWRPDGTAMAGFPALLPGPIWPIVVNAGGDWASSSQPALADIDGDGKLEIIVGSYVIRWDGTEQIGWQGGKPGAINSLSAAVNWTTWEGWTVTVGNRVYAGSGVLLRVLPGPQLGSAVIGYGCGLGCTLAGLRDPWAPPGITAFDETGVLEPGYPKSLYGNVGDNNATVIAIGQLPDQIVVAATIVDTSYGTVVALYNWPEPASAEQPWGMIGRNIRRTGLWADPDWLALNAPPPPPLPPPPLPPPTSPGTVTISVTVSSSQGPGGTVTSAPSGIVCTSGHTCQANFPAGQLVTFTATPKTGAARFLGWGGACSGTGSCTVTPTSAVSLTARFGK